MFCKEDCIVVFNDKEAYALNWHLANKQGLTAEDMENLKILHVKKLTLFEAMEKETNVILLKLMAKEFQRIEFAMQEAWKFPKDKTFHEWYSVPKCSCPKWDNEEMRGIDRKIISCDCIIHGS